MYYEIHLYEGMLNVFSCFLLSVVKRASESVRPLLLMDRDQLPNPILVYTAPFLYLHVEMIYPAP